jgi:hypothetical protein
MCCIEPLNPPDATAFDTACPGLIISGWSKTSDPIKVVSFIQPNAPSCHTESCEPGCLALLHAKCIVFIMTF